MHVDILRCSRPLHWTFPPVFASGVRHGNVRISRSSGCALCIRRTGIPCRELDLTETGMHSLTNATPAWPAPSSFAFPFIRLTLYQ